MVLNAKDRQALVAHSFHGLIVEVDSIDRNLTGQALWVHRKSMVLGRNLDFARFEIFHWLVGAPVPELELKSFASEGLSEDLVSQTDAKDGHARLNEIVNRLHSVAQGGRITRSI